MISFSLGMHQQLIAARQRVTALLLSAGAISCANPPADSGRGISRATETAPRFVVRDTIVPAYIEAAGVAEPLEKAVVSTKLMGTVQRVVVREGDQVARGALLAVIDSRDLLAKQEQITAQVRGATASVEEARKNAERYRALFADSAAPRAALDAAEAGLVRAESHLVTAQAQSHELAAVAAYANLVAPFAGTIVRRHVDAGGLALPGAPLLEIQQNRTLRVRVEIAPRDARVRRGDRVEVRVEGVEAIGLLDGVVPSQSPGLVTLLVNVANDSERFVSGSSATVRLKVGQRTVRLVPTSALLSQGNLVGVHLASGAVRWVRTGQLVGDQTEILTGLAAGDTVLLAAKR